jgi:two-component system OmpR family sensor kinase
VRLRQTLVFLQIAMVAAGLLIFGATSYRLYGQREQQRIQSQLLNNDLPQLELALCQQDEGSGCAGDFRGNRGPSTSAILSASASGTTCPASSGGFLFPNLTPGSFAEFLSSTGKVLGALYVVPFQAAEDATRTCPDPDLPASIPNGAFKVQARSGPGPFLVEAQPVSAVRPTSGPPDADATSPVATAAPARIVAGVPLNQLGDSLHHLLVVDLVVGAILLLALGAGSLVLIRRSLRPLERMAATSRAISAGDLSRRVTGVDERSEVGQLGLALNGMLTTIEGAFAARDATEQRLRQFLADASHELRTPLTSIRGYAELWRLNSHAPSSGSAPGSELDAEEAMARIEEHARRMGEMIEELLLLARLDEFRPAQPVSVDLAVLAAEACGEAAALDPGRPISLHADEDVIVTGELSHLRRAVANLLTNALRHTPPGTRVEVHVDKGDGVARVIVRDHGPGMPEAGLAHAFDRFWQADVSRGSGGSGLGLAIVAGVASEHGGLATVTNAPDGGAVLTLRLPLPLPQTADHDTVAPFPP